MFVIILIAISGIFLKCEYMFQIVDQDMLKWNLNAVLKKMSDLIQILYNKFYEQNIGNLMYSKFISFA